jgi:hypothetical protein
MGQPGQIFVSYARDDKAKARIIAEALQQRGWSVWWDRNIPPGKSFDQVIEEALASAKCVIVLWSRASASSDWVKTEAAEATKRRILVPALIEDVAIPLEFRRLQTANLSDWHPDSQHDDFDEFLKAIAGLLGGTVRPVNEAAPSARFSWFGKRGKQATLVASGVVVLAVAGLALRQTWQQAPREATPVVLQKLSWGPDFGKAAGACIDAECKTFLAWPELRKELEQAVFPLTPNLPKDASARLAPLGGTKDRVIQVTDGNGSVVANVWVGVNPAAEWRFDGVLRVGSAGSPPKVWASFERLSNGTYRRR